MHFLLALLFLAGCNVFDPLDGASDDNAYLEEAQAKLHQGDYAGAIAYYEKMGSSVTKYEKLCTTYLSKAGFSLRVLINYFSTSSSNYVLGDMATALGPYTDLKGTDMNSAVTQCDNYNTADNASRFSKFILSLSYFSRCTLLVAKTDLTLGADNTDTTCTTAGNRDGIINQTDVSSGAGLMCATDVLQCQSDMTNAALLIASYSSVNGLLNAIGIVPSNLKTAGSNTAALRVSIASLVRP